MQLDLFQHSWSLPAWTLHAVREPGIVYAQRPRISCSSDLANLVSEDLKNADREIFAVIPLDAKLRVIGSHVVSVGSLSSSTVHPREAFKFLITKNASAFFAVHNHPSGDPTPSSEDRTVVNILVQAGSLLGIRLTDFIIIGLDHYFSFADDGSLPPEPPAFSSQ